MLVKLGALVLALALVSNVVAKTNRSSTVRHEFVRVNACPSTDRRRLPCPGWQIDHRIPLKCNGLDTPQNMQWMTVQAHKEKTKREAKLCR